MLAIINVSPSICIALKLCVHYQAPTNASDLESIALFRISIVLLVFYLGNLHKHHVKALPCMLYSN